jgi:hypothetical protein
MHTNPIASILSSLSTGPGVTFENLTMFPLVLSEAQAQPRRVEGLLRADAPATLAYSLLDAALAAKTCEITEVSDSGSVPELRVINRGSDPVLIVDGEELIGAKQNRVVNLTILVAAGAELTIPVSCVEAGRWRSRTRTFSAAPRAQYATGRAKRMSQVTASMRDAGGHYSDQAEVWLDIAEKSARLGASSPTSAMEALFEGHAAKIDAFVRAMAPPSRPSPLRRHAPVDGQVGALFAVSDRIVGLDVFDRPETLRQMLPKLVRSVAIDAIDAAASAASVCGAPDAGAPVLPAAAARFLAALASAPVHVAPAVGLGQDVRVSAPGITGAALVVDGAVVHASGFVM